MRISVSGFIGSVLCALPTLLGACGSDDSLLMSPTAWIDAARQREAAVSKLLDAARDNSAQLVAFLSTMPKGADLHSHLSGAITTENLIQWGGADGLCVDTTTYLATQPPCGPSAVPLASAIPGTQLYKQVLAAWSMQDNAGEIGVRHQHFFDAFGKFDAVTSSRTIEGTDDVVRRAAAQGEVHLELLVGLSGSAIGKLADMQIKSTAPWTEEFLNNARSTLIKAPEFQAAIQTSIQRLNMIWNELRARWRCDTATPEPACDMTVRYLIQGTRTQSREYVFGQWVFGFELAQVEPRVVGVNLVAPEEDANSLAYYDEEMRAMGFLSRHNQLTSGRKAVHVSLHAGELIPQVLPMTPAGQQNLLFHIRHAVELAGAERIGHSADILGENEGPGMDAMTLLHEMAQKGVTVEACLTSNQQLLGLEAGTHPLSAYLAAGVPFALATDDEGILRTNLTQEYVRAAQVQGLLYSELKASVRTAVEKSFLQGQSLWANARTFVAVPACGDSDPRGAASVTCQQFLAENPRAAQQWKLETKLAAFEVSKVAP